MAETLDSIYRQITWHKITSPAGQLPDAEKEVLVYDGYLDDTVKASQDDDGGAIVWIEQTTGDPLQDPRWWTDVPFPDGK